jgi:hypothetical protein
VTVRDRDRLDDILGKESTWAEPSPHVLDEVLSEIEASPSARRGRFGRPVVWGGLAAAAAALVVGVAVVELVGSTSDGDGTGQEVALAGTELAPGASAVATLRDTPTGVAVDLEVEGLPPAPEGSYYQAWVKGPAGLVAIGTFHNREPDDEPVGLWSGVDTAAYPEITVTLEPEDGDPASSGQRVLGGSLGN